MALLTKQIKYYRNQNKANITVQTVLQMSCSQDICSIVLENFKNAPNLSKYRTVNTPFNTTSSF